MTTVRETALQALFATVENAVRGFADAPMLERNTTEPQVIPPDGLIIMRDGSAEEPEMTIGRSREYHWQHRAQLSIIVQHDVEEIRRTLADQLLMAVSDQIEIDNSLGTTGGSVVCRAGAPEITHERNEGAAPLIVVDLPVHIDFVSERPVG